MEAKQLREWIEEAENDDMATHEMYSDEIYDKEFYEKEEVDKLLNAIHNEAQIITNYVLGK